MAGGRAVDRRTRLKPSSVIRAEETNTYVEYPIGRSAVEILLLDRSDLLFKVLEILILVIRSSNVL